MMWVGFDKIGIMVGRSSKKPSGCIIILLDVLTSKNLKK